MARLESTKRAKLKTAKQHQPSQKSKSLTCCYLLPRFWVTPYLVPIGTVDLKKNVSIHKLFLSFPNKGGCSCEITNASPSFVSPCNKLVPKNMWKNRSLGRSEGPAIGLHWIRLSQIAYHSPGHFQNAR